MHQISSLAYNAGNNLYRDMYGQTNSRIVDLNGLYGLTHDFEHTLDWLCVESD